MGKLKKFFMALGPGFVTGASDDDPSGIATYAQTGAQFGYNQLWTALFSYPFMCVIQEMCGRIGLVTGSGLSSVICKHYAKPLLFSSVLLLIIANTVNIGADLGAMASAGQLLVGIPFIYWLLGLTFSTLVLEVFVSYHVYSRYLKYLTFSLFAYVITVFVVRQDWGVVLRYTFIPDFSFSKSYLMNIVAILGTTISPYLFFWQASEEVEKEVENKQLAEMGKGKPDITREDVKNMRLDTGVGMFFSNLVMYFIIVTAASTLGAHGMHDIQTATQAAEALRPLAGNFAYGIFAMGILGAGMLAVPVLAGSASYALSEACHWSEGLYLKVTHAHGFYGVIGMATLLGLLVNFTAIPPFKMLYYTAILNGLCAPPLILLILLIANNKAIMGEYTNRIFSNILGGIILLIMTASGIALLLTLSQGG